MARRIRTSPPVHPGPERSLAVAIRSILRVQIARLLELEQAARGLTPEGVHQMRSAARKLRGSMRVLRGPLDRIWAKGLSDEVRWLAQQLGAVRDLDVMIDALDRRAAESPGSVPEAIRRPIDQRRQAARCALLAALDSPRYEIVQSKLVDAARRPAIEADPNRAAGPALRRRLFKRAQALRESARALNVRSAPEQFHEFRKRAKDLRFAAQAMAPWLGKTPGARAERLASRIAKATDLLGTFQDHVVGIQVVSEVGAALSGDDPHVGPALASWVADQAALGDAAIARFLAKRKRWLRREDLQGMT